MKDTGMPIILKKGSVTASFHNKTIFIRNGENFVDVSTETFMDILKELVILKTTTESKEGTEDDK